MCTFAHTYTCTRGRASPFSVDRWRYKLPLIVTESGIADGDAHDERRVRYLSGCLRAVHAALADGVDVRGYTYWSLLDNFECAEDASNPTSGPGPLALGGPWAWTLYLRLWT